MEALYFLILPALMILAPLLILLLLIRLRLRHKTRFPIWISTLITIAFGLFMTYAATIVSINNFSRPEGSNETYCATGSVTFIFFGLIITLIVLPITGIASGLKYKAKTVK